MKYKMCPGIKGFGGIEDLGNKSISYLGVMFGEQPTGVKRKRLKCPNCKRRVLSSIRADHDGYDVFHDLPPHKPKGWWKKKSKKKERARRGRGR